MVVPLSQQIAIAIHDAVMDHLEDTMGMWLVAVLVVDPHRLMSAREEVASDPRVQLWMVLQVRSSAAVSPVDTERTVALQLWHPNTDVM